MIDVSKLPAVRAQLERDLAARNEPALNSTAAPAEYARAPQSSGAPVSAGRPQARQETAR